jgi:hypothetical protein
MTMNPRSRNAWLVVTGALIWIIIMGSIWLALAKLLSIGEGAP